MKPVGKSRARLDSPAAARLLRNPRVLRVLGAFLSGPKLLSGVSRDLGIPLNTVWRTANQLLACGVLRIHSTTPRAGRAVKRYEAIAPILFVPYEAEGDRLPGDVVRGLVEMRVAEQVNGLLAAANITQESTGVMSWGTLIYGDRHGQLVVRPDFEQGRTPALLRSQAPAYLNVYSDDLRLSQAAAKRLQRELVTLFKKYKDCEGPAVYTLSAVLAPLAPKRARRTR
jgi:hypothetical protein